MSLLPFDDRDGWIWLDGQFVPWREATVHVLTHGLHYASAVFEGERTTLEGLVHFLCGHDHQHLAGLHWLLGKMTALAHER